MDLVRDELGCRGLQLGMAVLLDHGLSDWRHVVVKEEVIGACRLSEWVYGRVIESGVV
jgi:hypothetical protein